MLQKLSTCSCMWTIKLCLCFILDEQHCVVKSISGVESTNLSEICYFSILSKHSISKLYMKYILYMYTSSSHSIYRVSLPVILNIHLTTLCREYIPSTNDNVRRLDVYIHSLFSFVMHILHVSIKPKGATSEHPVFVVNEGV